MLKKFLKIGEKIYLKRVQYKYKKYQRKEEKYHDLLDWYWCIVKSSKEFPVPFFTRLKMYKNGFNSDEYYKYNLKENSMSDYLTEVERWKSRKINGLYNILLDDKQVFYLLFKDYVNIPKTVGIINHGNFLDNKNHKISFSRFLKSVRDGNGYIFRINRGGGGNGLYLLKYKDNNYYLNDIPYKEIDIKKFIQNIDNYIVTEALKNSEYSARIFDGSVNTLRIVIAKKKNASKYDVIETFHRFGCNESIPGDNVCRGGLIAPIDCQTGVLGKATSKKTLEFYSNHPDTGSKIEGVKVPHFNKIKKELLELSYQFPFFNFIAWDVVVTSNGFSIIEANTSSDIGMFQYFGGKRNEKLGMIYRSYGIKK